MRHVPLRAVRLAGSIGSGMKWAVHIVEAPVTQTPRSTFPMSIQPPADSQFAEYPASWYLFGASREIGKQPMPKRMLGRRLVAYRAGERCVVLDADCAHLGADLSRGRMVGDCLQCPFHHWEYGPDGHCQRIPAQQEIPEFARQRSYPVVERQGLVFFFNGSKPLFPLPFFDACRPEDFARGRPFRFVADCSWYMLVSNGFDGQHFETVHDRRLTRPIEVECPAPLAHRMRFHAEVVGQSIFDWLLRKFVGEHVEVTITSWAGPFVLVTGDFGKTVSRALIASQPLGPHEVLVEVIVFAPRSRSMIARGLVQPINLWLRRLFTQGFMRDDIKRLVGIRYRSRALLASDRCLIDFFQWLAELPRESWQMPVSAAATDHLPERPEKSRQASSIARSP